MLHTWLGPTAAQACGAPLPAAPGAAATRPPAALQRHHRRPRTRQTTAPAPRPGRPRPARLGLPAQARAWQRQGSRVWWGVGKGAGSQLCRRAARNLSSTERNQGLEQLSMHTSSAESTISALLHPPKLHAVYAEAQGNYTFQENGTSAARHLAKGRCNTAKLCQSAHTSPQLAAGALKQPLRPRSLPPRPDLRRMRLRVNPLILSHPLQETGACKLADANALAGRRRRAPCWARASEAASWSTSAARPVTPSPPASTLSACHVLLHRFTSRRRQVTSGADKRQRGHRANAPVPLEPQSARS